MILNEIPDDIVVLDVIELLSYSDKLSALKQRLNKQKKDYFAPNERIVILHSDTEYYYYNHPTGFDTHNLFTIFQQLDIPLFVMLIVVNQVGYEKAITPFITHDADCPTVVNLLVDQMAHDAAAFRDWFKEPDSKQAKHPMLLLLGSPRAHRLKFFQFVKQAQLENYIAVTYSNPDAILSGFGFNEGAGESIQGTVNSIPHRINQDWCKYSSHKFLTELDHIVPVPTAHPLITNSQTCDFYKNFLIDIVAESVFGYPYVLITEKTIRPILFKTPFVMLGPPGMLAHLRNRGIKTFNNYWDESYDTMHDHQLRFISVCNTVKQLCSIPVEDLQQMYYNMKDILDHNRNVLLDQIKQETIPVYKKLKVRLIT